MIEAAAWAALGACALIVGALCVRWLAPGPRFIAMVMALGSGVLVASVAFDLVEDALAHTGLLVSMAALLLGAVVFTVGARVIERSGGRHRKQPHADHDPQAGLAIALGSVLDGVPESFVLGLTVLTGGVSIPLLMGIGLSNLPEGMASSSGLLRSGWPLRRVLAMWLGVVAASAVAGGLGYGLLGSAAASVAGAVQMFAGGALFAMIADTMVPEAYEVERNWTGLLLVAGFAGTVVLQTW